MKNVLFTLIAFISIQVSSQTQTVTSTIAYQGYDESQAYFGEGEYELFVDTIDGVLDKPIIMIYGFDPGDGRDIAMFYAALDFNGENLADISGLAICVEYLRDIQDKNEDIVTNGEETVRFSQLIQDRGGYRHLEHLGTKPNVYYLPAVNRQFPLERGFNVEEDIIERYKDVPYVQDLKKQGKI